MSLPLGTKVEHLSPALDKTCSAPTGTSYRLSAGRPILNAYSAFWVGEPNPRKPPSPAPNSPHGPQTRPRGPRCTRTGLQNLPTAKQICSGEKLREFVLIGTLAAPDHELPGPAPGGLARQCPPKPGLGRRQMSPGEHTQTPGATPRKDSRILKNQPQVNERPRRAVAQFEIHSPCAGMESARILGSRQSARAT